MKRITWKIIKWGLLLYVFSFAIEWLLDIPIFTTYVGFLQFIKGVLQSWWDWFIIIGVSIYICRKVGEVRYETQEKIRRNRFSAEIERYQDTPYISPLFFYYLTNPPQSYSRNGFKEIENRFYQGVINAFRDRVYINAHYNNENPESRPDLLKLIGSMDLIKTLVAFSLALGWFASVTLSDSQNWVTGWERFSIPFIVYLSLYAAMKLQAYVEMRYSILDRVLLNYYGEPDPRIRWLELLPQEGRGSIILKVWEAERERRQRYTFVVQNRPIPDIIAQFTNPSIAAYPYPSLQLPDWVEQAELFFEERQSGWAKKTTKAITETSNIVPFNKRIKKQS